MDFLLVLIDLFARYYGWGATSDYRFKIGDVAPTEAGWPKIAGRRGRPCQPFFFSKKLGYTFVWCKNPDISFFRFVTMHAFDRQTDTFLIASPRWHSMQRGKKWDHSRSTEAMRSEQQCKLPSWSVAEPGRHFFYQIWWAFLATPCAVLFILIGRAAPSHSYNSASVVISCTL